MTSEELGKEIRAARKAAKLSQEALAMRLGTSRRQVMRWESGKNVPENHYRELLLAALPKLRRRAFAAARPGMVETRAEALSLSERTAALEREVRALTLLVAQIAAALNDRGFDVKPPGSA